MKRVDNFQEVINPFHMPSVRLHRSPMLVEEIKHNFCAVGAKLSVMNVLRKTIDNINETIPCHYRKE